MNFMDKKQPAAPGSLIKNHFDIDNDGTSEIVYSFHPSGHGYNADVYFKSPGGAFDKKWPKISEKQLWESSPYIFPINDGQCRNQPCGQDSYDHDGELIIQNYLIAGVTPIPYRFRYLHVTPFIWRDNTYFMLRSVEDWLQNITTVVKPIKNKQLEEVCVFRTKS
jgi:hypothetical protein